MLTVKRLIIVALASTGTKIFGSADGTFTNSSNPRYCGTCSIYGAFEGVVIFAPWGTTVSAFYATEVVTINANGTTTEIVNNTDAVASFTSSLASVSSEISSLAPWIFPGQASGIATFDAFNGSYITMDGAEIDQAIYSTEAIVNGTATCQSVNEAFSTDTQAECAEYIGTATGNQLLSVLNGSFIPDNWFTRCGIYLPPDCHQDWPGQPLAQVPVQYLTATLTVNNIQTTSTMAGESPTTTPTESASPGQTSTPTTPSATGNSGPSPAPDTNPSPSQGSDPQAQPSPIPTTIEIGSIPFSISGTQVMIGTQTLLPGSALTFDGTAISLDPAATALVIGTETYNLSPTAALPLNTASPSLLVQPALTIGSALYTENAASALVIGGQTLMPGGAVTVGGTVLSLEEGGSVAVVAGATEILASVTETKAGSAAVSASASGDLGPGGVIWSAFHGGGAAESSTGAAPVTATGGASRKGTGWGWMVASAIGVCWIVCFL